MLDKEFIRAWLMERGYMGEGTPPTFPDDFRIEIAKHYITAYEIITGEKFRPYNDPINQENIIEHIKNLNV